MISQALDYVSADCDPRNITHILLDRLDKVRRTGPQKFIALCPAHADKSPSLSIRETSDGTILFHCHAGCSSDDVLSGAGLSWTDILPNKEFIPRPIAYPELELDYLVIEIWQADRDTGKPITGDDLARYKLALRRTGAELRKRQAPYSKRLQSAEHAFLWYGLGAWERAAQMPTEGLVLPPFRDPQDFHWPVDDRAVILIDCGKSPSVYSARIERCLRAIASLVVTDGGRIYEC